MQNRMINEIQKNLGDKPVKLLELYRDLYGLLIGHLNVRFEYKYNKSVTSIEVMLCRPSSPYRRFMNPWTLTLYKDYFVMYEGQHTYEEEIERIIKKRSEE